MWFFFFQAEDGIRYLVRSRGLGDVYKRQVVDRELEGLGVAGVPGAAGVVGGGEAARRGERDLSLINI